MRSNLVHFLVIFTATEYLANAQIWPWQTTTAGSLPTPSTKIDGIDGGVISLNYAFDVNNLIPNGMRKSLADGLTSRRNEILNILGSIGGTNIDTLKMLNAFTSTIDQFEQSRGANADMLVAQLNALRQQLLELSEAQLQRSYSTVSQSNSSLVLSAQTLGRNIGTQLRYLESIISPTLPCASQAYSLLRQATDLEPKRTARCVAEGYKSIQNHINFSKGYIESYIYNNGPKVYEAVQRCNNQTSASLLISDFTKSSACWFQAALQIKSDTVNMLYGLTFQMAWHKLYSATTQISLAHCAYSALDIFSPDTINTSIEELFSCAGFWNASSTNNLTIKNNK